MSSARKVPTPEYRMYRRPLPDASQTTGSTMSAVKGDITPPVPPRNAPIAKISITGTSNAKRCHSCTRESTTASTVANPTTATPVQANAG